ncbi:MAG: hypothetical protein OWU84_02840 [Firmicutes bacterium]|nr:hypothetical protein [Bacillota bacterium]
MNASVTEGLGDDVVDLAWCLAVDRCLYSSLGGISHGDVGQEESANRRNACDNAE